MPPLPEGCAIVAVASPLRARLREYARSADAIAQCCLEGRRGVFGAEIEEVLLHEHELCRSDNKRESRYKA